MSWFEYYKLLKKYWGDLAKATPEELRSAAGDHKRPGMAIRRAQQIYYENFKKPHAKSKKNSQNR